MARLTAARASSTSTALVAHEQTKRQIGRGGSGLVDGVALADFVVYIGWQVDDHQAR
ncbi:MAG TPA: hypothetical protein VER34_10880 [Mycobacterium sp.]|jgi:hypothetical protein|nr:hypothetical protein [Mycobacterium sp.]